MSQGYDSDASYIKEMKDAEYGLSLRRELNLAKKIAKEFEETGKNIIGGLYESKN